MRLKETPRTKFEIALFVSDIDRRMEIDWQIFYAWGAKLEYFRARKEEEKRGEREREKRRRLLRLYFSISHLASSPITV
jgi:hypothetical protein